MKKITAHEGTIRGQGAARAGPYRQGGMGVSLGDPPLIDDLEVSAVGREGISGVGHGALLRSGKLN